MSKKLPALFIGHGSPMNAISDNSYTRALKKIADEIDRPEAILVVSAHWQTRGTYITYKDEPTQIYDFYGFPEELYNIKYEPKNCEKYSKIILDELKGENIKPTSEWGLDHASWAVLIHMYPKADIPVIEMSLNILLDAEGHYELGKKLYKLREKGILVIGSGNIVHNLMNFKAEIDAEPFKWAVDFDKYISDAVKYKQHDKLINYKNLGKIAQLSVPTDEHYLPLLYTAAMQWEKEGAEFEYEGIQNGSMSMRCIKID